jgi:hypothetical protein
MVNLEAINDGFVVMFQKERSIHLESKGELWMQLA